MRIKSLVSTVAGLVLVAGTAIAQSKPTVAVLYFNNSVLGKDNEAMQPLSKGLADLLINNLSGNAGIRVVERDRIQAVLDEQACALGHRLGDLLRAIVGDDDELAGLVGVVNAHPTGDVAARSVFQQISDGTNGPVAVKTAGADAASNTGLPTRASGATKSIRCLNRPV